jgi:hypothetical protein
LISAVEKASAAGKDQVSRIVLLSDGRPNVGNSTPERLIGIPAQMTKVISLSTFGYGSDYDPELLASMSSAGRGNHFFIQTGDDCKKAFALELGGLLSLFAQDIKVTLALSGNVAIDEFLSAYPVEQSVGYRGITGAKLTFTVADIYCGEKKHAIIKMKIPQASEAVCARPSRVCDITVDYLDVSTKARGQLTSSAKIQYVKPGKVAAEANKEVQNQVFLLEAAKKQQEASAKAASGDYIGSRSLLQEAAVWASNNAAWSPDAGLVAQNFQNLTLACADAGSYRSSGNKLFASYSTRYASARGASSDTISQGFVSAGQVDMLKAFAGGTSAVSATAAGVAIPAGTKVVNGAADKQEKKAEEKK